MCLLKNRSLDMGTVFIMQKTITKIQTQKQDQNRINIYLDDEFAFGISRYVGAWLKQGMKIEDSEIEEIIEKESREKAFQKALHYINYQPRSTYEVREKLSEQGFSGKIIEDVIREMQEKSYISDQEFAENWVESRCRSKPRSHKMLRYELKKKQISDQIIEEVIDSLPSDVELAIRLGKKYLHRFENLDKKDFEKKMTGIFSRKAFSFPVINSVLTKLEMIREDIR